MSNSKAMHYIAEIVKHSFERSYFLQVKLCLVFYLAIFRLSTPLKGIPESST